MTWDTAFDPISVDDSFSFGIVLSMLFFDTILYFIVAWLVSTTVQVWTFVLMFGFKVFGRYFPRRIWNPKAFLFPVDALVLVS